MRRFIPTIVVIGVIAVGFVVFARRLKELNDRIVTMERRTVATSGAETRVPESPVPTMTLPNDPPAARATDERHPQRPDEATSSPRSSTTTSTTSVLTAEQQAAVAHEVERILKERRPSMPVVFESEDPLEVLEKELGLTPGQKLRIAEIFKHRDEELRLLPENHSPQELSKLFPEIEERYEQATLRELDVVQQKKYEELQKAGKLLGRGTTFYFSAQTVPEKK